MTALDSTVDTAVEELRSTTKQNAESISSLESKLDTFTTQDAESISELKLSLEVSTRQNSSSIEQNAESISVMQTMLHALVKQNAKSFASFRADLEQLEKEFSQFRLDVHQEFSQRKANQTKTIAQLVERVDELHDGLQRTSLLLEQCQENEDASSTRDGPFEGTSIDDKRAGPAKYNTPFLTEKGKPAFWRQSSSQLSFATVGLIVVFCGPMVAELYAKKHKKLAESLTKRLAERT